MGEARPGKSHSTKKPRQSGDDGKKAPASLTPWGKDSGPTQRNAVYVRPYHDAPASIKPQLVTVQAFMRARMPRQAPFINSTVMQYVLGESLKSKKNNALPGVTEPLALWHKYSDTLTWAYKQWRHSRMKLLRDAWSVAMGLGVKPTPKGHGGKKGAGAGAAASDDTTTPLKSYPQRLAEYNAKLSACRIADPNDETSWSAYMAAIGAFLGWRSSWIAGKTAPLHLLVKPTVRAFVLIVLTFFIQQINVVEHEEWLCSLQDRVANVLRTICDPNSAVQTRTPPAPPQTRQWTDVYTLEDLEKIRAFEEKKVRDSSSPGSTQLWCGHTAVHQGSQRRLLPRSAHTVNPPA